MQNQLQPVAWVAVENDVQLLCRCGCGRSVILDLVEFARGSVRHCPACAQRKRARQCRSVTPCEPGEARLLWLVGEEPRVLPGVALFTSASGGAGLPSEFIDVPNDEGADPRPWDVSIPPK